MDKLDRQFTASNMWGKKKATSNHPPKRSNKRVTPKKELEAAVQKDCMDWLKSLGLPCNRQNSGKICIGRYYIKLAESGSSDIVSVMPDGSGRILEIESKRLKGGRQSDDQKGRQKLIEGWNGVYILANSLDVLKAKIKEKSI